MFGFGKKKEEAQAPAAAPAESAVALQPAGFWLRAEALIVDYAVVMLLGAAMLMGAASVGGEGVLPIAYLVWAVVGFLYWPVLESSARRGTVGKMLLGLVVADVDGGKLSFVRSLLRNLAKILSAIPLYIGFVLAAFTTRKQALHDLITKAVVLRKGPSSFARAIGVLVAGLALMGAGAYLAGDQMSGAVMKLQAMVSEETPVPPKPATAPKPAAKPAPAPVAKPVAPPAPPATAPTAKPAAPAPAAKPVAAPAPAPAPKPAPEKVAAAPKPPAPPKAEPTATPAPAAPVQSTRPRLEPLQQLSGPGMESAPSLPSPRFNDVMTAVLYADREAVTQLLDQGRWPDKRDSNGLTPLMVAAMTGDAGMVRLLLERGADTSLQAPGGAVALDFAQQSGDAATTQLLQR